MLRLREGDRTGGRLFREARTCPFPRLGLCLLSPHTSGLLPADPCCTKPRVARSVTCSVAFTPQSSPTTVPVPARWQESICLMSKSFMSY